MILLSSVLNTSHLLYLRTENQSTGTKLESKKKIFMFPKTSPLSFDSNEKKILKEGGRSAASASDRPSVRPTLEPGPETAIRFPCGKLIWISNGGDKIYYGQQRNGFPSSMRDQRIRTASMTTNDDMAMARKLFYRCRRLTGWLAEMGLRWMLGHVGGGKDHLS